jgi:thiamine-monophosphate kinase
MTEAAILKTIVRYTQGIGDDCAILAPPSPKHDMLMTVDSTIEAVHFPRDWPAHRVGHKAIARSLSDIAAMGGTPLYCLVSLTLAPWIDRKWIAAFYRAAAGLQTPIVGGDISHAPQFAAHVTVCGQVPKGKALRRDGAQPGDRIYVSGPLGGWTHKHTIIPRLDEGRALLGKATACIDITDGLALDLHRLCLLSGVAAELTSLPLLNQATPEQALHGGEDYELLYTAPGRVPGIEIGVIVAGKPGTLRYQGKRLQPKGYDHAGPHS